MKKLAYLFILISFLSSRAYAQEDKLYIMGDVKNAVTKVYLKEAYAVVYKANGDTIHIPTILNQYNRVTQEPDGAAFYFPVDRKDSTYVFDVECPGYITKSVSVKVDRIGKRERYRQIPTVYLERAPHQLSEVTVRASKIKFYNKGDTLVYNADAFQLAEGSMLDALIAQLPGVELSSDGVIKVNGEYVESLLLNGKQFLDGNNKLMLENIGAYTVKNVEVYKGQTDEEKWIDDPNAPRHLTMDVKLKKEYNNAWIVNAQGGAGTEGRYSGRVFSALNTPTKMISLIGNLNNLNDSRTPGKNDTWTPEQAPNGTKIYKMGALNYSLNNADRNRAIEGHVIYEQTSQNVRATTARTNFLSGGDTYENNFDKRYQRDVKLEARDYLRWNNSKVWLGAMVLGRYITNDNDSRSVGATFNREQTDITMQAIEALYSDGTPDRLNAVINRSITRSDASRKTGDAQFFPAIQWKIPRTNDRISFETGFKYSGSKEHAWKDYMVNYGADPVPADRRRQYLDNSPNFTWTQINNVTYSTYVKGVSLHVNYEYRYLSQMKDSYTYALDRLGEDMGIFGTLPSGWYSTLDESNSYTSRLIENTHSLQPSIMYVTGIGKEKTSEISLYISPTFSLKHTHFNYFREGKAYPLSRNDFLTKLGKNDARLNLRLHRESTKQKQWRHELTFDMKLEPKTPNPLDMTDVVNDADPLNIDMGNPSLRPEYAYSYNASWLYKSPDSQHPLNNTVQVAYNTTRDALTRGYTYNTSTGVRKYMTYNVDGGRQINLSNNVMLQFGKISQFTLSSATSFTHGRYADMVGINLDLPEKTMAYSNIVSENLRFGWQIGNQGLGVLANISNRHTNTGLEGSQVIDARHYQGGLVGHFRLPYGVGIDTDFTAYSRDGYGSKELDTTDLVWNMRVTFTPTALNGRWIFMVDGFDMLHQLSNVNYAVGATGRTISYTNALPRYILFSAQYRINIQPKKRK